MSLYNKVFRTPLLDENNLPTSIEEMPQCIPITYSIEKKQIVRKFHNFTISKNAYRTLQSKINWLYYYSKPRHINTYKNKNIYNYKLSFITLTLPSKQKEPTKLVTQKYFNQFLTEIRQRVSMQNYVWRLEFQKNGNVHYHIVTDSFLDYYLVKSVWNRVLSKGNYVQEYTDKHKNLSLYQYNKMYNNSGKINFNIMKKRYINGCKNKWKTPPSVDVRSVTSRKKIGFYIAKYFGKNSSVQQKCNALDNAENSKNLRLWFCSRSLSKLDKIRGFCEENDTGIWSIIVNQKKVRLYVAKWAKIFSFNILNFAKNVKQFYEQIFEKYRLYCSYSSAV